MLLNSPPRSLTRTQQHSQPSPSIMHLLTNAQILSLLFLLPLVTGTYASREIDTQFMEAPFFHNSLQCRRPIDTGKGHSCCRDNIISIAMTLDDAYLRGSMAAVLSIIHHSTCPQNLHFHFIYSQNEESREEHLKTTISTAFPYLQFDMYSFGEEIVTGLISTSLRQALDRPLNYARSYLARLLPACLHRVIYLDSDVILVDDIAKLWSTRLQEESTIAAPEYCDANLTRYFTPTFWSMPALSSVMTQGRRSKACYFNTGVMVVDLERWRARDHTREIEEWMEVQKRMRIYELGSLPPFLLVFSGEITAVDPRWNQHGLGGDNYEGHCRGLHPGEASLLHWSGRGKPWIRLDGGWPCPVDALWAPYDMLRKPIHDLD